MILLKKYHFNIAWYALVELDDGSRVELKLRQEAEPTEQDFLTLAASYQVATAPKLRKLKALTSVLQTINCQDLATITISQLITYLNTRPALYPVKVGDYLTITLNGVYKLERLDESERVAIFNMTIGQLWQALKDAVAANPGLANNPVRSIVKAEVDD